MIASKQLPPPDDLQPVRRALLSVFDKEGIVELAAALHERGVTLLSTGGTARALEGAGLPVIGVETITGYPETLDGRVKTLHPAVHAGLLARRNDATDMASLAELQVDPIDLVVVNLYPFEKATADPDVTEPVAIENIDIGGPTMIRAAAKNFYFVGVVTSPADYPAVIEELERTGGSLTLDTRRNLARKAFRTTSGYDDAIARFWEEPAAAGQADELPDRLSIHLPKAQALRYGENPHQKAALYGHPERFFEQLHGKELSFNNLMDLSAALALIDEFQEAGPTCAILKHTNPCGAASAETLLAAYEKAFATDRQSPFGGIVAVNGPLDRSAAEAIDRIFTEIVIAPEFEEGVVAFLEAKKNRRIIRSLAPARTDRGLDIRYTLGGLLVQDRDPVIGPMVTLRSGSTVATRREPTMDEWLDLDFAWRIVKHVKSNAIVYARDRATLGIGAGQMSRIDSSEIALMKGRKSELDFEGCVVASDAFFPFADGLIAAATTGATAVIQPGGSVRDDEVIAAADEHNMAMVLTGMRHFRH